MGDATQRESMGAAGRERALTHFSVEAMTRAYERLYDDVTRRDAA